MRKIDEIRESFERGDNMFVLINARLLIELAELDLKGRTQSAWHKILLYENESIRRQRILDQLEADE